MPPFGPVKLIQRGHFIHSGHRLRTFVDGGMIEAFAAGVIITALVNPVSADGPPEARVSSVISTAAGVRCVVQSFQLSLNPADDRF